MGRHRSDAAALYRVSTIQKMFAAPGVPLVALLRGGGLTTLVLLCDALRRQDQPDRLPRQHGAVHIQS